MSGLVKGVKKVFKAIGSAVKKILKSPIFKAILIGAAAIFTGGFAIGAFGAMGTAGATFGSVMSAGLAGGLAPFQAALGALGVGSGASGVAGAGTGVATGTATAVGEGAALGAAEAGGALAGAEASALASGVPLELGMAGEAASGIGGGYGSLSGAATAGAEAAGGVAQLGGANLSDMVAAPQGAATTSAQAGNQSSLFSRFGAPTVGNGAGGMVQGVNTVMGAAPASEGGNFLTSLWNFVKPETKEGALLWGQTLSGIGGGLLSGRNAEADRAWRERMSQVPDMRGSFELKPGHPWALAGAR